MTQVSQPQTGAFAVADVLGPHDQQMIDLGTALIEAAMDDASVLNGIPHGATLVLLPEDDPAFTEEAIAVGLAAIRQGRDVLFRHVRAPREAAQAEAEASDAQAGH